MTTILLRETEPIEPALKRFKKECVKAGIFRELKTRKHYEKPSAMKRRKLQAACRKARRNELKMRRIMDRY